MQLPVIPVEDNDIQSFKDAIGAASTGENPKSKKATGERIALPPMLLNAES